ncbi:MAG: tetratricopeptide repeat protein [Candidatus Omnitrophota bacterium]
MKKALMLAPFLIITLWANSSCAMDWKKLHEAADKTMPSDAFMRVQANPTSVKDLYILGLIYLNQHKDAQARNMFSEILKMQPDLLEARWGTAEVLRREHELKKSRKILEEIIKSEPKFSPAYISLAYIDYLEGDFEGAASLAEKVLKQGREAVDLSNYVRAYLILGGAKGMIAHYGGPLSKVINGTAVLPNLKKAQELKPNSPEVFFGMGGFYLLAPGLAGGDINLAIVYLEKAVKADPMFADAYVRLGEAYKIKGNNAKHELYLRKALEIDPKNELALDARSGRCKFICPQKR